MGWFDDHVRYWNTTPAEQARNHPADRFVDGSGDHFVRAIDVDADAATVFRWLCQLKVAPYSYDLIDNLGRRSPQQLTPGAEHLEVGQRFAVVLRIAAFETNRSITAVRGPTALSYEVTAGLGARSRILACFVPGQSGLPARLGAAALGAGDLVMMRRQLRNLKALAERPA